MKSFVLYLFIFFLLLSSSLYPLQGFALETFSLTDATKVTLVFKKKPARIVTLAPSLGELAADVLGSEIQNIVGVSEHSNYPPQLKKIESIGPYYKFNLEKVVALKPDLILATLDGNPKDPVSHLRELGLPVVVVSTSSLQEVEDSIRLVGIALGQKKRGDAMANQLHRGLEHFKDRALQRLKKTNQKPRVLIQVGEEPLVVAGGQSFLSELIELVGGTNIYQYLQAHYPRPSPEDILSKNPDLILILSMDGDQKKSEKMVEKWVKYKTIDSKKKIRVRTNQGETLLRPTLRLLEGLSQLEKSMYEKI